MTPSSGHESDSLSSAARQLGYALESSGTVDEAFEKLNVIADARQRAVNDKLRTLLQSTESSQPWARAIRRTPYPVVAWLLNQSKHPARTAAALLREFRRHESFSRSVRLFIKTDFAGFLSYLSAVLLILILVTFLYGFLVLPAFKSLYTDFGASLPGLTRIFFFQGIPLMLLIVAVSAAALIFMSRFTITLRRCLQQYLPMPIRYDAIPLVGPVARSYREYLWLSYAAALRTTGLSATEALNQAGERLAIERQSSALNANLNMAAQLGKLDEEVTYQQELSAEDFLSALERCRYRVRLILTAFIYFLVAITVSAMYQPIFSLGSNI